MPYEYQRIEDNQFRVIQLPPGEGDVYVEMSVEDLDDNTRPYDALSWEWGKEDLTREHTFYVRNTGNNDFKRMPIQPNLLWALRSLRQLSPGFQLPRLWVDFICINQKDLEERARQVAKMTQIYVKAQNVHVWLGKPGCPVDADTQDDFTDKELEQAVDYIKLLGNLDDANHLGSVDMGIRHKAGLHNLGPLFKLLKRGWFGRRWIVQEIGVARKATVHCGDQQFSWEELTHAVALLERIGRDGSIDRLFKHRLESRHVSEHVGNISALPAYRLVQNVSGAYRYLGNNRKLKQYTLEQLVCFLVIFQCSNPKDIIYAVLGVASDVTPVDFNVTPVGSDDDEPPQSSHPTNFQVKYKEEATLHLYKRFLKHAIRMSRSLDILCRPWAPAEISPRIQLPSWILDVTRKPFRATAQGKMVRYNPDPFVGPAVSSRGSFYSASGRCVPKREKGWFKIGDAGLQVLAFKLANLNEIWDSAVHGSIPTSWLRAVGWRNARIAPPEELWRTLVADRTSVGLDPEPGYSSIIQSAALEKGVQYGINTNEFIREKDNAAYYEVFRRVEAVVWSRKLVRAGLCGSEGENKENKNKEEEEKEGGKEGGKEEGKKDDDEEGDEDEQGDGDEQGDEDEQGGEKKEEKWEREAREEREEMEERREKEKRGSLGLVPAETEITDGIYIVQGCSVPLVLRQTGKQQEGRETYKLIGECYINNMMDGEAMIGHPGWVGITLE